MKIAYILYELALISGKSNGIRSQALSWKKILEDYGNHEVVLINTWEHYEWGSFDAIHIFGYEIAIHTFVKNLVRKNPNIYISPIIDSTKPYGIYKRATFNGLEKLRLYSNNYALRKALHLVKGVLSRTNHESGYYSKAFGLEEKKIFKVPLSFSLQTPEDIESIIKNKENFCFHISSLSQPRKNVKRLVEAAIKYKFKLVLAGSKGTGDDFKEIENTIANAENITVLGYISDSELIDWYSKAKVFALPSTNEGVGIVALDAALYGCNILMTNIPGPKEYYPRSETLEIIDPSNVDDIGRNIIKLLNTNNNSFLSNSIAKENSDEVVFFKLNKMYTS